MGSHSEPTWECCCMPSFVPQLVTSTPSHYRVASWLRLTSVAWPGLPLLGRRVFSRASTEADRLMVLRGGRTSASWCRRWTRSPP
jgi:hypothetical protein